jgi:hypothetical protein
VTVFFQLAVIVALGIGLGLFIMWLERKTRVPGLAATLLGTTGLLIAIASLVAGMRLLPIFLALLAIWWLYEGAGPVLTHMWRSRR